MAVRREGRMADVVRKPRWHEGDGRAVVEAWERSGEDLRGFAAKHSLPRQRIWRWAEKLGIRPEETMSFHPVRMIGPSQRDGRGAVEAIEIVLVDGRRVRVPGGFAAGDLARVLEVLEGRASC
jgi:hypothetical protein